MSYAGVFDFQFTALVTSEGRTCLWGEQMKNAATDLKYVDGSQYRHIILSKPEQVLTKDRALVAICAIYFAFKYRVSGLEVYKNTCFSFSILKLYEIYFFNSVQSNSKRFLCTSVHFNVGTFCSSTYI